MAAWSQSPFLQSLGWAMFNSLWQMALLFALHNLLASVFKLSAQHRYKLALGCLAFGFAWFCTTFLIYDAAVTTTVIVNQRLVIPNRNTWNGILTAAALAYFLLLLFPASRLFRNWRYLQLLKHTGIEQVSASCQIFVLKVSRQLNITAKVQVYISKLVTSPVTFGYLKPIILLPIAALNNLTPQQIESILLHELSHIKRYDFVINLLITFLQTLFYFNPFVKKFVSIIALEREICCDELVMQLHYDKISYASALLSLEMNAQATNVLTIAAAEKKHLLFRIEQIVGLAPKKSHRFQKIGSALTALFVACILNLLMVSEVSQTFEGRLNPARPSDNIRTFTLATPPKVTFSKPHASISIVRKNKIKPLKVKEKAKPVNTIAGVSPTPDEMVFTPVIFNQNSSITSLEKRTIRQTIQAAKKVLTQAKWREVEKQIGDGMTNREKVVAKKEYLQELNKVNWNKIEGFLQHEYQNMDWLAIQAKLNTSLLDLKLDSIQHSYNTILNHLIVSEHLKPSQSYQLMLLPDASLKEIHRIKIDLHNKIDSIQGLRGSKVVNF